jgi:pyruvate-formate lyase-activating enzyme
MQLLHNGNFRTCCYYPRELQHQQVDIPALWHGDYFKNLRRLIAGGDPTNSHCEHCDYIKYFARPVFLDIPRSVTGARRRNWERALEHHRNGVVDIDTFPIKYYMQFGVACNIRCVMCNHPQRYINGENSELSADRMLEMAEYLKLADSVHLIGGEPLIIPNAIRFVEGVLANQDLWDVSYVFYTNALNLGDFLDRFLRLERVVITASIDSSGASYEAIRRRSSWTTVTGNLERFARLAREHNKREWEVHVSTILMKSSLLGLPDLFSWCIDNNFSTNIVNIGDLDGLRVDSEHIFRNPALLNEVPGWEGALQRSMEMLSRAGRNVEAHRLEEAITELSQGLSSQKAKKATVKAVSAHAEWDTLFDAAGQQLIDGLVHFLYGRRKPEGNLAVSADGIQFMPTHQGDHLASPFLDCEGQGERWMRVVHEWTGPSPGIDPQSCVVILQDEQCFELAVDDADVERGDALTVTQYVRVPAHKDKIRIRVTLPSQQAARLPDKIRLEQLRPAPLVSSEGALRLAESPH